MRKKRNERERESDFENASSNLILSARENNKTQETENGNKI